MGLVRLTWAAVIGVVALSVVKALRNQTSPFVVGA